MIWRPSGDIWGLDIRSRSSECSVVNNVGDLDSWPCPGEGRTTNARVEIRSADETLDRIGTSCGETGYSPEATSQMAAVEKRVGHYKKSRPIGRLFFHSIRTVQFSFWSPSLS